MEKQKEALWIIAQRVPHNENGPPRRKMLRKNKGAERECEGAGQAVSQRFENAAAPVLAGGSIRRICPKGAVRAAGTADGHVLKAPGCTGSGPRLRRRTGGRIGAQPAGRKRRPTEDKTLGRKGDGDGWNG